VAKYPPSDATTLSNLPSTPSCKTVFGTIDLFKTIPEEAIHISLSLSPSKSSITRAQHVVLIIRSRIHGKPSVNFVIIFIILKFAHLKRELKAKLKIIPFKT
jgi:hypothetical protein